jgi:acetyl-CoA C-acetyltransferase
MAASKVYVLGGWQTDFAANWQQQGDDAFSIMRRTVTNALETTWIDAKEVQSAHVGNFAGELFLGQGLLAGMLASAEPVFEGLPICRHEAACASGSIAMLAAGAEIEAGRVDLSRVVGLEMMRNVHGSVAAKHLAAASWVGHEFQAAKQLPWLYMVSELRTEYENRYGEIDYRHLGRLAELDFANARLNTNAQTRGWNIPPNGFSEDDDTNPELEGRTRRQDCGQITDGAATLFLASEEYAGSYAKRHGILLESIPYIKGWGHRTARLTYADKIEASRGQPYIFPVARGAVEDAFNRAGIVGTEQLDVVETHDCFTMTGYLGLELIGITPPGEAWKAIEDGRIERNGSIPVNPGGGLMGLGHPVGATGVRMALDAWKQIAGRAGDYQVDDVHNVATLNMGGSLTANVCMVIGNESD